LWSGKAFDVLEKIDPMPDYWDGKRSSIVGLFRQIVLGAEPQRQIQAVVDLLRDSNHSESEHIFSVVQAWCKRNRVEFE
jgi:intraflagellar transport protein 56